jgi:hypothetical protein
MQEAKSSSDTWPKNEESDPVYGAACSLHGCELQPVKVFLAATEHLEEQLVTKHYTQPQAWADSSSRRKLLN